MIFDLWIDRGPSKLGSPDIRTGKDTDRDPRAMSESGGNTVVEAIERLYVWRKSKWDGALKRPGP
jgi:hypothetical protein